MEPGAHDSERVPEHSIHAFQLHGQGALSNRCHRTPCRVVGVDVGFYGQSVYKGFPRLSEKGEAESYWNEQGGYRIADTPKEIVDRGRKLQSSHFWRRRF